MYRIRNVEVRRPTRALIDGSSSTGALLVTPEVLYGSFTPTSPAIIDNFAGFLRGLMITTVKNCHLEFWRSANADPPIATNDYSNITWLYVGDLRLSGIGDHPISQDFLGRFGGSRYIKIEPLTGDMSPVIHRFAS
jgi:hypothetical protein